MYKSSDKDKNKPLTYEQIRDIVLERKEDVKEMVRNKKRVVTQKTNKKVHNFEFV